ncbi:MAG: hypothetical protein LC117_02455 [Bacteroidia bacterium]|nr:hypothetical protein [Bacteroidia bacterium]MCZ2276776.1 hypothetical protein [Bacteroidia bacterium]
MLIFNKLKKFGQFILLLSLIYSCQKDIPLLGEDEQGNTVIVPRDSVFISSIILIDFDTLNEFGNTWDSIITVPFDSGNFQYPDVYYNIGIYDTSFPFSYYQQTHFQNVNPFSLPLAYSMVPPIYIPGFGKPFYLRVFDLDLTSAGIDSTLMDSILFVVEPDFNLSNPYQSTVSGTGSRGTAVSLGLLWQ